MAKRIIHELVDDIDGTEASATVTFSYKGVNYEIDLNDENAAKLDDAIKPWADAARKVAKSGTSAAPTRRSPRGNSNLGEIREWARANGHTVSEHGRIPQNIVDAYNAAH